MAAAFKRRFILLSRRKVFAMAFDVERVKDRFFLKNITKV